MKKIALILAGGSGARLWPISSDDLPKQYIDLTGEGTLFKSTYDRIAKNYDKDDIYIITFSSLENLVYKDIPDFNPKNLIKEPFGRNTGPAIALALVYLNAKYADEDIITVYPSDHLINNVKQ